MINKKLPIEWEWRTLGDVCEINPSVSWPDGFTPETPISFVPMADVDDLSGTIAVKESQPIGEVWTGYKRFLENDVLFARITPCMENGKSAIATGLLNGIGTGSTEFHVLRPKKGVLSKWIHYFVRRGAFLKEAAKEMTGTAGQQRLPKTSLEKVRIPVPNLETQHQIVAILDKVEETKRLKALEDELTHRLLPSLFFKIFGNPWKNPMKWKIVRLADVSDVSGGVTLNERRRTNTSCLYPYLRVANVFRNKIDLSEIKYISLSDTEINKYAIKKNDVLIVEGHGNAEEIGRSAVWTGDIPNCAHQNHLIKVRPRIDCLNSYYLSYFLNLYGDHGYFFSKSITTSGLNTINITKVQNVKLPLPPLEIQQQFANIVQKARAMERSQSQSRSEIDSLFNVLMQTAFTGVLIS